jgi:hypothetical protein
MALSQSVESELLDAFRAGDGVELIRDAVRVVLQELIEVEATEATGAGRLRTHQPACLSPRSPVRSGLAAALELPYRP